MFITPFIDLPDLVILHILRYLSSFDAIQAFYNIDITNDRILNLLIEARCFSTIHHFRLPVFNFICNHVLSRIGTKLSHITLSHHQLSFARRNQILLYLSNLSSLHLINIDELPENDLSYFLHKNLKNLKIEFVSEHHIDGQAYLCEQFIFNRKCENLIHCHLLNTCGIQLRHLNLFSNTSLENLTIQLKELSDLHILFDHLLNIKILNIELCRWTIEDIKYDYTKLPTKLSHLIEFSLQIQHTLSFNQLLKILQYLVHLQKLSLIYRNYDEHGIDIHQLELTLNHLQYLTQFHCMMKFIYFNLNQKLTFENHIPFKQRWNIHTYNNSLYKNYLAYTQPFFHRTYSISSDILLHDDWTYFPMITNLSLTTHTKQLSFLPIIHLVNSQFPSLTHLHIMDSFGIEENNNWNIKLTKIHSFDASDLKISNLFYVLFQSMPNLIYLQVNSNVLIGCNLKFLLAKNQIKSLELITNNIDQIQDILLHFSALEQFIINTKKQSFQYKRKLYQILFHWFDICSKLYTIHVKAHKLSDLFDLFRVESNENMHVQYSNEILTVWK